MSFSFDGFWQGALAYEPALCVRCDERVAMDAHGYCGCCHWKLQPEIDDGLRALRSYLANWAAFSDWDNS